MSNKSDKSAMAVDMHNIVSPAELQAILSTQMDAIDKNDDITSVLPPILIHGSPGLGKTSIVRELCKERGIGFVPVLLSQIDSVDIRGLPSVNKEEKTMTWNPPDFWPRGKDQPKGILFFDEITAAPKDVQVAAYEIILERKIGNIYSVPKGWYIVAAGNDATDHAVATTMSSALANRFMHVEITANAEDWVKWGVSNEIHPSVIGYINYRPASLFNMDNENLERGWPSPRSWEKVSHMIDIYGGDERVLRKIVYGLVGNRVGVEFCEFHKLNSQFDSVLDMMLGKKEIVIPTEIDRRWALCSAMTYLVWRGKDAKDEEARLNGFFEICMKLSSDFATMSMVSAMNGNKSIQKQEASKRLFHHKRYKDWVKVHGTAMRKRYSF